MTLRSLTSSRLQLLSQLTFFTLLGATLPGCLIEGGGWIKQTAVGEPKKPAYFALSANSNSYEITRWWDLTSGTLFDGKKTISILRRDLPEGCKEVRFFLNDSTHEFRIAQPIKSSEWVTMVQPPLPNDNYPACALLVSYGSFSGPPTMEGVAVTSSTGLIATSERQQPHPTVWALAPAGLVADSIAILAAPFVMPFLLAPGAISESADKSKQNKEKSSLPLPVAACWTGIAHKLATIYHPAPSISRFDWTPNRENSYVFTTANEAFSDEEPIPIDSRVLLRQGSALFLAMIEEKHVNLFSEADAECGLREGRVVAVRVKLRK
ncbi:MAG: hypothetical protein ACOYL3_27265 [Desulfuromonadaceae bacterium]